MSRHVAGSHPDRFIKRLPAENKAVAREFVGGGARRMLDILIEIHPEGLTRQDLGTRANIAPSSGTMSNCVSLLNRRGYVQKDGHVIRASEVFWPSDS